jgi:glycosyltransferase involved in cell wall biosynthesis
LKIAHLVAPARFGGLERVVRTLAANQRNRANEVTFIALLESGVPEPPIVSELRNDGVDVIPLVYPPRSFRAQRRSVLEICGRVRPEVLHTHGYLPDVISASFGRSLPAVRVTTVHGFTGGRLRNRIYEWMQRRSFARLDAVVAVSKKMATELAPSTLSKVKLHALPNAWASTVSPFARDVGRKMLNVPGNVFTIGWVGRLSQEKAADILIEALPKLADLPVHVVFIGDGVERAALESKARELGVNERVSWSGELTDASRFFPAFDVFVNSSRTEGTPITLFEAMDSSVPIIATAVGGVPDVVSSEEAILIPPGDAAALAAAIRTVHDKRDVAVARAERARRRLARDFAVEPWVEAYSRIYRTAIETRRSR